MKKIILFLVMCSVIVLAGCNKEKVITCTLENNTVDIKVEGKNLIDITIVSTFESESIAKSICSIDKSLVNDINDLKCESKKITVVNYQNSLSELKEKTKDGALKYFKEQGYSCK